MRILMSPHITVKKYRGRFKRSTISFIYSLQKCRCFYCNKFLQYIKYHPQICERKDGYTIDHLFPRTLGFTLYGNAVIACRKCNEEKSDRLPTPEEVVRTWTIYNQLGIPFIASVVFPQSDFNDILEPLTD